MAQPAQPMSLMTVNSPTGIRGAGGLASGTESQLLTLRILEASERKMQMIKKLLTPEDYSSLASDLFNHDDLDTHWRSLETSHEFTPGAKRPEMDLISVPAKLDATIKGRTPTKRHISTSKSESNLNSTGQLSECLTKRRRANEFFFDSCPPPTSADGAKLAGSSMERKRGQYLKPADAEAKRRMISCEIDVNALVALLVALLNLVGLGEKLSKWWHDKRATGTTKDDRLEEFRKRHCSMNSFPYSRESNILYMAERLRSDGQLDEMLALRSPRCESVASEIRLVQMTVAGSGAQDRLMAKSMKSPDRPVHLNETMQQPKAAAQFGYGSSILVQNRFVRAASHLFSGEPTGTMPKDLALMSSSTELTIELGKLELLKLGLVSMEERCATRLVKLGAQFKRSLEKFSLINENLRKLVTEFDEKSKASELVGAHELWSRFLARLLSKQREILSVWSELQSIRSEQQFAATMAHLSGEDTESLSTVARSEMIRLIGALDVQRSKKLQDYEVELAQLRELRVQEATLSELPSGEIKRQQRLRDWCSALSVRVGLGAESKHEQVFSGGAFFRVDRTGASGLDWSHRGSMCIRLPKMNAGAKLKVQLQLLGEKKLARRRQVLASGTLETSATNLENGPVKLGLRNEDRTIEASLSIRVRTKTAECQAPRGRFSSGAIQLIESLYSKLFNSKHPFDNIERKSAKILNRIDFFSETSGKYCVLDANCTEFPRNLFEDSLRLHLLARRWTAGGAQQGVVYMSERENLFTIEKSARLAELRAKFSPESRLANNETQTRGGAVSEPSGHQLIEQARAQAVEHIRQLEQHIEALVHESSTNGRQQQQQQQVVGPRAQLTRVEDVLLEPKMLDGLRLPNLPLAVRLVVPRPSARRPLMAKRVAKSKSRASLAIDQALSQLDLLRPRLHYKGPPASLPDIERHAVDKWKKFAEIQQRAQSLGGGDAQLRLVVTVQQAANVPLRLIRHSFQTASLASIAHSSSPFGGAASPAGGSTHAGLANLIVPPQQTQLAQQALPYLSPATTFVEAIFQRQQQATSLAQGQNPAWNESLFFPVELSTTDRPPDRRLAQASGNRLLVDEFLQLNLYDCHWCTRDLSLSGTGGSSASTLALSSSLFADRKSPSVALIDSSAASPPVSGQQPVTSALQRIERHLIGSLRIPLATLISSGRVEGSFAMAQPMLLDNYQFSQLADLGPAQRQQEIFLSVFITLDPPVAMQAIGDDFVYLPLGTCESDLLFEYARLWEQTLSRCGGLRDASKRARPRLAGSSGERAAITRRRSVRALVLARNNLRYCLACRFVGPLEPPRDFIESEPSSEPDQPDHPVQPASSLPQKMARLARFVSMLSPLKHGLLHIKPLASSLWFDSEQLLAGHLGGPEEKAVLLCNYFLWLGRCSAVLLGESIASGQCAFVVVWQEQSRFIENQLQLQMSDLLDSIGSSVAGAHHANVPSLARLDASSFLSRLPVIIGAKTVQLWDPSDGRQYAPGEPALPLLAVGSIITCENIYANVQPSDEPAQISFDVRLRRQWWPLLPHDSQAESRSASGSRGVDLNGIKFAQLSARRQLSHLESMRRQIGRVALDTPVPAGVAERVYASFSLDQCGQLRAAIERTLKAHLLKWRPNRPTYFNRTISRLLADKLASFERQQKQADWKAELARLIRSEVLDVPSSFRAARSSANYHREPGWQDKQIISWPANLAYTSMQAILDGLYASGVHNADLMLGATDLSPAGPASDASDVQFLLACQVFAQPAHVMSVWLYVGAIVDRR